MIDEKQWATVGEAAKIVGVTTQGVRERCRAGRLDKQRLFGVTVVRRSQLEPWRRELAAKRERAEALA
jgi:hypothetical protein